MLEDSPELRGFIQNIYPNFVITGLAKKSGQRVVYYGSFSSSGQYEPTGCDKWGDVVLKISEATSRSAISYIQKEVEVLKELKNPHYPKLFFSEVITIDPSTEEPLSPIRFVSIEERIIANSLTDIISTYDTESKVIDFLHTTISAMDSLWSHPQKLVHRDLKPDNILVKDDGEIIIIDLGLLREEGSAGVTNSLCSFGPCTPFYASPEQAINDKRNITFKSDMFSLGIIGYEMLSRQNPFFSPDGENYVDEVLEKVCSYEPVLLSQLGINKELSTLICKMMSKEPYKRYRTPEKLLSDLNKVKDTI